MTKQLRFIHAADLHLGAPFRGLRDLSESWSRRLGSAIPEAYDRVIDAALSNDVDFVILAGDIFDTSRPSYGDYLHFFDGLKRLSAAGIPVYLVTGNHDPYTSWQKDIANLPAGATILGIDKPTFELYERDGEPLCMIGGRSYYNQTWPLDKDISEGISRQEALAAYRQIAAERKLSTHADVPFAIGVIHTGLTADRSKAPADPDMLLARGMDYWACGHIHARSAYPSDDDPRIVYPGCIQGRDIKEGGSRGCYLVTLEQGAPNKLQFIPTASVTWQKMKVNVEDCQNVADIHDKILRTMFKVNGESNCEEMCVRVVLVGQTKLHDTLRRAHLIEDMRESINASYPSFFCDALIDSTDIPLDRKALAREGLFPALFMDVASREKKNTDEEFAYLQDEFIERGIEMPSSFTRHIEKYAADAESIVLDLLMEAKK